MAKGTIMFKNMANKFKVYLECKISDIKNIKELGIIEVLNRTKVIIISLISFMMIFGFIFAICCAAVVEAVVVNNKMNAMK